MSGIIFAASRAVADMEVFRHDDAGPLRNITSRYGVETLAIAPQAEVVEGEAGGVLAVLRFPDRAAVEAWYADPDDAPLLARRTALTDPGRSFVALAPEAAP
ncbi:MAG: DUF1330 domain-containing protein [Pseudomonadota bacterium]